MEIQESAPAVKSADLEKTLIFQHITKTAGTTLKRILAKQYYPKTIITLQKNLNHPDLNDVLIDDFIAYPPHIKENIRFIRGHFEFGIHRHLSRPYTYITMLRDPIERAISWYYFVKQNPDSVDYQKFVVNSDGFEDFVRKGYGGTNSMTRVLLTKEQLKGAADDEQCLQYAKSNLESYFAAVGIVEKFNESLILFKEVLGWKYLPVYIKENMTQKRPRKDDLSASTLETVREKNWADIELYNYVFGKFQDRTEKLAGGFHREVERLNLLNTAYKASAFFVTKYQFQQALELLQSAQNIDSNQPDIAKDMGQIYFLMGNLLASLQCYTRALKLNPYDEDTIKATAGVLEQLGRFQDASALRSVI